MNQAESTKISSLLTKRRRNMLATSGRIKGIIIIYFIYKRQLAICYIYGLACSFSILDLIDGSDDDDSEDLELENDSSRRSSSSSAASSDHNESPGIEKL
jgi:hypothetical protein